MLKHANHYLNLHWVIIFSLVVATNLQCVQNTVSLKLNKMRCAILALNGLTLLWARSQSHHLQWAGGDWLVRVLFNCTILCYLRMGEKITLQSAWFLYEMSILQRGNSMCLEFSLWEFIHTILPLENSQFYPLLFSNKEVSWSLIIWWYQRTVHVINSLLSIADTILFITLSFKRKVTFEKQPRRLLGK